MLDILCKVIAEVAYRIASEYRAIDDHKTRAPGDHRFRLGLDNGDELAPEADGQQYEGWPFGFGLPNR